MNKKLEYNSRYNKEKYTSVSVRFNTVSEADILEHLKKQDNVKPYLAALIRKDMKRCARNAADRQRYHNKKKEKTTFEVIEDLPYEGHDIIGETEKLGDAVNLAGYELSTRYEAMGKIQIVERAYDPDLKCWRGIKVTV